MIEMFPLRVYPLTIKCIFQQLLNVSVEDANAKRYFYAVQGSRRQKGELFGVKNMFQLNTGSSCKTVDILKVSYISFLLCLGHEMAEGHIEFTLSVCVCVFVYSRIVSGP